MKGLHISDKHGQIIEFENFGESYLERITIKRSIHGPEFGSCNWMGLDVIDGEEIPMYFRHYPFAILL